MSECVGRGGRGFSPPFSGELLVSSCPDTIGQHDTSLLTRRDTLRIVARMFSDFKSLIEAWPPHPDASEGDPLAALRAFAADIGVSLNNAKQMRRRNAIHGSHWLAVVEAASMRGVNGVTLQLLAEFGARRTHSHQHSEKEFIQGVGIGQSVSAAA